jgi:hypothetical protein
MQRLDDQAGCLILGGALAEDGIEFAEYVAEVVHRGILVWGDCVLSRSRIKTETRLRGDRTLPDHPSGLF